MKKLFSLLVLVLALFMFVACSKKTEDDKLEAIGLENVKIGFITLHDEQSTYDKNFLDAIKNVKKELNLRDDQLIIKTNIDEGSVCYDTACDLVDQGCNIIFADSFGHEAFLIQAAKEFPKVQFCHATGTKAHTEKLANYHNAFASIYEGRFLAGVAAGMKLNEMIDRGLIEESEAIMGYVGAWPYAEVKSGYTSFYLGAKYVCPSVKMVVRFTNSWYDVQGEHDTCAKLITTDKAVLISQHADSMGAPSVCEEKGVPNVFYNGKTNLDTFLCSSRINWEPYFKYMINSVANGVKMDYDYIGTLQSGSVEVYDPGTCAAANTKAKMEEVKAKLLDGSLKVFDTNSFTVDGKKLTSYLADVDDLGDYVPETEVIKDGYFNESAKELRSAPYFDLTIDGITAIIEK